MSATRDFLLHIAVPTVAYFVVVALCIGIVTITAAVVCDVISDPTTIFAEQDQ